MPDGQSRGFALGRLARAAAGDNTGGRSAGGGSGGKVTFGDIHMNFTGPVNLDDPKQIDTILEGMAQRLKDKVTVAFTTARLMSDANEEESDRAV